MDFSFLVKWATVLAPLLAQGVLQVQSAAGVNHQTVVGNVAGWILALAVSKAAHASHTDGSGTTNP